MTTCQAENVEAGDRIIQYRGDDGLLVTSGGCLTHPRASGVIEVEVPTECGPVFFIKGETLVVLRKGQT